MPTNIFSNVGDLCDIVIDIRQERPEYYKQSEQLHQSPNHTPVEKNQNETDEIQCRSSDFAFFTEEADGASDSDEEVHTSQEADISYYYKSLLK